MLEWDFSAPDVLQALAVFSQQILSNDSKLAVLEQVVSSGCAEAGSAIVGDEQTPPEATRLTKVTNETSFSFAPVADSDNKDLPAVEPEFYYNFSPSALASPPPETMTPPHLVESSITMEKQFDVYEPYAWDSPHSETDELFPELNFKLFPM